MTLSVVTDAPAPGGLRLCVEGVSRRFGATQALRDVCLEVQPGRIHALLGGNGSGKSTLIKILAGTETADQGSIRVGEDTLTATATSPQWSAAHGLRFVHQDLGLFNDLSIAENLVAGRGYPRRRFRPIDRRALDQRVRAALARVHLDLNPAAAIAELGPAQRTMVAIARALDEPSWSVDGASPSAGHRRIVVLDEPTAALPSAESRLLFDLLRHVRDAGDSIVFVSHRLGEVAAIADSATVLRDGCVAAQVGLGQVTSATLHELMSSPSTAAPRAAIAPRTRRSPHTQALLTVSQLHTKALHVERLAVQPGEVVGLLGLSGSGTKELLATIFGALPGRGGSVVKGGRPLKAHGVADAVAHGIGYVPAERHMLASFLDHDVADNLLIASLHQRRSALGLSTRSLRRDLRHTIGRYGIKAPGPDTPMAALSGGNQQKVIVARWLERQADLLLLDEPTQGVDVAARADIWNLIHQVVSRGTSVLLASTDLDEVAEQCGRVLLMTEGVITRPIEHASADDLARALFVS